MKNKFILIFLFFFVPIITKSGEVFAHVDKMIYLQGKVGEKTLVLKIKCYYESPIRYLNYFFEDDKKDHYLEGSLLGNAWQFNAVNNPNEDINLVIREESDGNWKGFWRKGSKSKINLILTPIVISTDSNFYSFIQKKELDLYDAAKISLLHFENTKTEKFDKNFELEWFTEKESNISLFRLRCNDSKIKLDSINNNFTFLQLSLIQNYFHYNPNGNNSNFQIEITTLNESLISFKIISNSILINGNTMKSQHFFNFDLKKGNSLVLEDIIWFDGQNSQPETDMMANYGYRKEVFAPKVFSILNELYPQQMQNNDCNLNKETNWTIPDFCITKKGIQLCITNSANCNLMEWAIIPFEKLEPYLLKKYQINR